MKSSRAAVRLLPGNQYTQFHLSRFSRPQAAIIGSACRFSVCVSLVLSLYSVFKVRNIGLEEQARIVDHVLSVRESLSASIGKSEEMLGILAERRTALISAAVTGKIDVRGWQPPESQTAGSC